MIWNNPIYLRRNKWPSWAEGTDEEIAAMVAAADRGEIILADYWKVGDSRQVTLSAMAKGAVGETHAEQSVTLVLMNAGGKTLENGKECSFIVGQKKALLEEGYLNSAATNEGGWKGCARRTWCNDTYYNAFPAALRGIFKQFKNVTGVGGDNPSGTEESVDYFALPAEIEVFGKASYSAAGEGTQFLYYGWSSNNRKKKDGDSGSYSLWWLRSPNITIPLPMFFCLCNLNDAPGSAGASEARLLAPFGCI